jgi:hypothetical protein
VPAAHRAVPGRAVKRTVHFHGVELRHVICQIFSGPQIGGIEAPVPASSRESRSANANCPARYRGWTLSHWP